MKLLTLNTHSLVEKNYPEKLDAFVSVISGIKPDIVALQEVNQTASEATVAEAQLNGFTDCGAVGVKADNHAFNAVKKLRERGVEYYWTWLGIKRGYGRLDEGIAVMSRSPILETRVLTVSSTDDRESWKTRRIVGIRPESCPESWFFSVHYGWWNDPDEPFQSQWKRTAEALPDSGSIWLMGDFNNPAEVRNEGYDMMMNDGWHDSFMLAEKRDSGITVGKAIDGWHGRVRGSDGMRLDLILSRRQARIISSEVIFNGENKPVVSDHYGVLAETEEL